MLVGGKLFTEFMKDSARIPAEFGRKRPNVEKLDCPHKNDLRHLNFFKKSNLELVS